MDGSKKLLERLRTGGPAFLLLGQQTWGLDVGQDQIASLAYKYLQHLSPPPASQSYTDIFCPPTGTRSDDFLGWLGDQLSSLPVPEWIGEVSRYPWNGIFTSSISERLNESFRAAWRDVQPIYGEGVNPLHPRNRTRLATYYLFGALSRTEKAERVPLSKFELVTRSQIATQLLSRVAAHVTPLGTLVIDAYRADDWLTTERLFSVISKLSPGQAFLCSANQALTEDVYVVELVKQGRLQLIEESLASLLQSSEEVLQFSAQQRAATFEGSSIFIEGKLHEVPRDLAVRLSATGRLLTGELLDDPFVLSQDQLYSAFRAFLGEADISSRWLGYARGLSFVREYQTNLLAKAKEALGGTRIGSPLFLIHGQSGSGKTTAAGWLAFELLKERKVPIIVIEKFDPRPGYNDLDEFLRWAEDIGSPSTVVVWDAMADPSAYVQLRKVLAGRGRKVLLIGTTYRQSSQLLGSLYVAEAPSILTPSEQAQLQQFLERFDPDLNKALNALIKRSDPSFLVALYRLLPPTRHLLRAGLAKEAAYTEDDLHKIFNQPTTAEHRGALALALLQAGLVDQTLTSSLSAENKSIAHDLVGLVMAAGLLGLDVPFDIVLRALNVEIDESLLAAFRKADLFRWHEDRVGNIFIGARTQLEAKLIAQARIGGMQGELDYAKKLIEASRANSPEYADSEIEFLVSLLRGIGPNGPEERRYKDGYRDISASLRRLRDDAGVQSSRLMLQEATLLREWFSDHANAIGREEQQQVLDEAEKVLRSALNLINESPGLARHKSNVLVELASLYGTRATQESQHSSSARELQTIYERARETALQARALDPEHRNPLDVILWTGRNILDRGTQLPIEFKAEIAADAYFAFDLLDEDELDYRSAERVQQLKQQLARLLDRVDLEQEAFDQLERLGSKAGFYIRATVLLGSTLEDLRRGEIGTEALKDATRYLEQHREKFQGDVRCLRLLLKCWWGYRTGQSLFFGERQSIPLSGDDLLYCLALLDDILAAQRAEDVQVRYLKAVLLWQLGDYTRAGDMWKELQRDSDFTVGSRRVIKSHLSTGPNGVPIEYHGTVAWINPAGTRGRLLLEHGRTHVDFFPLDHGARMPSKGDAIGPFFVAFNYIGPVADPTRHASVAKRR